MRTNDSYLISGILTNNTHFLKMTKTRTITFLMMTISAGALIISLTDAHPTTEIPSSSNETETHPDSKNNSRLVITHVVKTIEFEVGVLEDDGLDSENETAATTPEYIETDIKLFNVDLLREILDKLPEEESKTNTDFKEIEQEKIGEY